MKKTSYFSLSSVITAIAVGVFVGTLAVHAAWSNPTANPPANNTAAPLDMSNNAQQKNGALSLATTLQVQNTASFLGNLGLNLNNTYANALVIPYGNVGIGTATPGARLDVEGTTKLWGALQALSFGVTYTASTDGMVNARVQATNSSTVCWLKGVSAGSEMADDATPLNNGYNYASVSFPVWKGTTWSVSLISASANCLGQVYFAPLGSGLSVPPPPPPPPPVGPLPTPPAKPGPPLSPLPPVAPAPGL